MKALLSILLGAVSSVFLSAGLLRAAQICDPQSRNTVHVSAVASTLGCDEPCQLTAPGCDEPCQYLQS